MIPLVSVLMVTHNHFDFIGRAIESVLMQKTSFDVELVIGEDASTDGTRQVVESYSATYPERILAFHHAENLGMGQNFFHTLKRCRGKYIALLDGDDRWITYNKLSIQVDFLEKNPHVVACGGNTISESNVRGKGYRLVKWMKHFSRAKVEEYGRGEIIISNRLRTLTVVGRAENFKAAEPGIGDSPVLDWPFYVNLSRKNAAARYVNLPFFFGAYNVHSGGVFSGADFESRKRISARARQTITSLTHGRYLGWHFPVLLLAGSHGIEKDYMEQHYRKTFPELGEAFSGNDLMVVSGRFLHSGGNLLELFGFIFGSLYQRSVDFDHFSQNVATLMKMISRSSIAGSKKEELLGSIGTAWRDTLFYSNPGLKTLSYFLKSPLKKYAGIYWYTVVLVYRQSHIHR